MPPSWKLADELVAAGAEGPLVPSVQYCGGTNLLLWRWHQAGGAREGAAPTLLDPERELALARIAASLPTEEEFRTGRWTWQSDDG